MKETGKLKTLLLSAILAVAGSTPVMAFDNTNILVEEAVNHIYQQRYKLAHQSLKQAYEQSPRHPGVHFNLGRLFELTGNFAEALKEYRLAASLDTSMVAARRGMARCSVELKRTKSFEAQQQQAQTQPAAAAPVVRYNPPPQTARIVTQQPAQPTQPARVISQPATQTLPPMQQPVNRAAAQDIRLPPLPLRATAQASKPAGEQRAEALLDSGKTDEAVSALEEILQNSPDSPRAHFLLGKALSVKGDLFASIKHLEECLRVDDKFYDAYYLLGRNYSRVNLLEDAIKNYQIYYVVKPQASVALEIARIFETMGNPDKAKEYYSRANAMNPGNTNLQMRLSESSGNLANDLYLRGNNAFTVNQFEEAANLFSQSLETGNLQEGSRRDAVRKLEIARFKIREAEEKQRPAREGFAETRHNFAGTNLKYFQLSDISFKTRFTGPITVEWRGYVSRKITRYGRDFLLMIKELSQDELEYMNRDRNDYKLNSHFNNQPTFLLATRRGGFPPFAREGQMITFNGTTDWQFYNIINDLGQTVSLPSFEFVSAYPD
ncbi:MAG: tetratricopeptide repeat protein [Candidatus Riflebacteria bacterium]|nr:tetratricopeptide repeat protein [Candidatus Riflebacteria bacterium]